MRRFEFTLFADYFQFYLQDENADGDLSNSGLRKPATVSWQLRREPLVLVQLAT